MCSSDTLADRLAEALASAATVGDGARALAEAVRRLDSPDTCGLGASHGDDVAGLLGLREAVEALVLEHLAAFDRAGEAAATPALRTTAWVSQVAGLTRSEAGRLVGVAGRLHVDDGRRLPGIAAAVARGDMTTAQARAVADATRRAPVEVIGAIDDAVLVSGTHLAPEELGAHVSRLVTTLLAQLAPLPEPGDPASERSVRLRRTLDGWWHLEGLLEPDAGALLREALDPMSAPVSTVSPEGDPVRDPRTRDQRQHDALVDLAGMFVDARLPARRGECDTLDDSSTVPVPRPRMGLQVVIDADRLGLRLGLGDASAGTLLGPDGARLSSGAGSLREVPGVVARTTDGTPLTGPTVEHLRCDAEATWWLTRRPPQPLGPAGVELTRGSPGSGHLTRGLILPARLDLSDELLSEAVVESLDALPASRGGTGRIMLDAGRLRRTGSSGQRQGAYVRDKGCVVAGCTAPAWWCELHHLLEWILGGLTDLDSMALVCPPHHRFLHREGWSLVLARDTGTFFLIPPPAVQAAG